jgi:hypothetical protein
VALKRTVPEKSFCHQVRIHTACNDGLGRLLSHFSHIDRAIKSTSVGNVRQIWRTSTVILILFCIQTARDRLCGSEGFPSTGKLVEFWNPLALDFPKLVSRPSKEPAYYEASSPVSGGLANPQNRSLRVQYLINNLNTTLMVLSVAKCPSSSS